VHLEESVKIQDDSNNKHSAKPKIWCFKMPNALYLNRYPTFRKWKTVTKIEMRKKLFG